MSDAARSAAGHPPINTHTHLQPNFSAFSTVDDVVGQAAAEGIRVLGCANDHDFGVYATFEAAAASRGVSALFVNSKEVSEPFLTTTETGGSPRASHARDAQSARAQATRALAERWEATWIPCRSSSNAV